MNCVLLSTFVGGTTDCKNIHCINNINFANTRQARAVYNYKNTKEKLHKTNAAVRCNKVCEIERLTPKYIQVKGNGNNRQSINTNNLANTYRLNQELKFLYK